MTITPQTEYTIIDPEYIFIDKSIPANDPRHNSKYIARPLIPQELDIIYKGGHKLVHERWKWMNYGSPKRKDPYLARLCEKHLGEYPVIVSEALINDLGRGLYLNPLPSLFVNDAFIEWLSPMTKMQVYALMLWASTFRKYFWQVGWYCPQSYIIADYIAFAKYLRMPLSRVYSKDEAQGKGSTAEYRSDSEGESDSDAQEQKKAKELSWAKQFQGFVHMRLDVWKMNISLGSIVVWMSDDRKVQTRHNPV